MKKSRLIVLSIGLALAGSPNGAVAQVCPTYSGAVVPIAFGADENFRDGQNIQFNGAWGRHVMTSPALMATSVRYRFCLDGVDVSGGWYYMSILYASGEARPIIVTVNNNQIFRNVAGHDTGGFGLGEREWEAVGWVQLGRDNTVFLERGSVFPHISRLRFDPGPPGRP